MDTPSFNLWTVTQPSPHVLFMEMMDSAAFQTSPWAHPASHTTGTGSFPQVKQPGCGFNYTTHPTQKLKKGYSLPLLLLYAFIASYWAALPLPYNNAVYWST